jgi:glycosyltransferase involved in cell wall biosynthesis
MRVTLSVSGKYYAFDLAQQLLKRDCLEQLITGYPRFKVKKHDLPSKKLITLPLNQVIYRVWTHLPRVLRDLYDPNLLVTELFDRQARRRVRDCDIFVGWAGLCLHTMRRAQSRGAIALVERGSSHMLFQQEILQEEYDRLGLKGPLAHPGIIKRELQEYMEADYVSIPSQFVRRTFLQKGFPEEKLIQVPYGVDLSAYRQVPKEDGVFRVIFSGSMCLRKGVHYLLKAFSELKLPDSELLLVGSVLEEILPFFKKYEGVYRWVNPKPPKRLYHYYSQGSVFVMPSIEEGMAMVQLQAMACGLPLICTTNTGGEDLIENGEQGYIIPIRDVGALKEKLVYLYENHTEREEMGRKAMERAQGHFSWDNYGRRTIENYQRILAEEKGTHPVNKE